MIKDELKNKVKKRILTNTIDIFFIYLVLFFASETTINKNFIVVAGVVYSIIVYKTGYTFGSIFTNYKLYWYGKKTPYLFIKRQLMSIFYFFLLNTIYPLKYNMCGQYEYDISFSTYFNNKKCETRNFKKLITINTLAFNLRWFMLYFLIISILIVLIGNIVLPKK